MPPQGQEPASGPSVPGWIQTVTVPGVGRRSTIQEAMRAMEKAFPKEQKPTTPTGGHRMYLHRDCALRLLIMR